MTPEEQAKFAGEIRRFSPREIDRLHRVLFRLHEESVDFSLTIIKNEYRAVCLEDRYHTTADDPCLRWLLSLLETDPESPLNEKFLDILEEAHIILTADGTTTDGGTEYEGAGRTETVEDTHAVQDRLDSPDSLDENDPLWRQAVALDNRKLTSQALEQWRHKLYLKREAYMNQEDPAMNALADSIHRRNLARKAISHWRNTVKEIQVMDRAADEFRARRDAACALRQWTLAARERLFARVRDERLLCKTFQKWREKTGDIDELNAAADEFRNHQALRNTLRKMMAKIDQIKQAETQADLVSKGNLVRKAFNKWLVQLENIQLNERRAEAAAEYFASKHALQDWREKTRLVRMEKEGRRIREQHLAVEYLRKWRALVKRSKDAKYNEAYKVIRRRVKMNIARAALHSWREKTARIRGMKMAADEFRARKDAENARRMAHGAIVVMYNRTEQMQEAKQQANLFFNKHLMERLQIFGSNWLVPTRQILESQKKADEYRATRTASYALSILRSWRNVAFRAKRLEEDADVVFQRNERKRALGFLQKWRRAVNTGDEEGEDREERLIPTTPAARRSQLLASTTPVYTPAPGLFGPDRVVEVVDE
ncbi:uncharacterized protein Z518_06803 [Rhinocladiella mackenziei CBS 650.93]|uniref:Sfi1 spindle body domain-containing protein n=1 Tax=Rhinocladiella mackenziei CBS 650.93 TaxID=1442369 RepID=A0A0D2IIZ3_9EURO|nr:uncharacterized protein Z518_06803 [Rhinocladiella mackenziei CBS 650.93]KIX03251.1 hypothetical protein Z518_06803 [Rhinocladiella mackenziei CBS 650.93]